jgi:hypothetical protein
MGFDATKTTAPPRGRGIGIDGRAALGADGKPAGLAGASDKPSGKLIVQRRHVDWIEHQVRWRWLLDSFEGGDRYRNAVYGPDRRGLPARNLFRHRREYPDPQMYPNVYQGFVGFLGSANAQAQDVGYGPYPGMLGADPAAVAQDDDYELRRARTPVPGWVVEACSIHLGKLFDQEVSREGPADLEAWWADCDGRGTPIDDYMRETIAPLLLVLGCLDVCLDRPAAPPGEKVKTRADELRLGLDRCVASYILPQNMVWWRCDAAGRYLECLVREYVDPADRIDYDKQGNAIDPEDPGNIGEAWRRNYLRYRHWTADGWTLYSCDGSEVLGRASHPYGRVPIVRLVDLPKHRTPTIGKSRYEEVAELQREYYNRSSELILSDTLQAHPFLSGAEDFCKADNTLSVGPGYVLPMKKNPESGSYQGWEFVSPPKDPAESLRKNLQDLIDAKDRAACLAKPAGAAAGSTTAQSGVSKQLDAVTGHKLLASIARSLARAERILAEYAAMVLRSGPIAPGDREAISAVYPGQVRTVRRRRPDRRPDEAPARHDPGRGRAQHRAGDHPAGRPPAPPGPHGPGIRRARRRDRADARDQGPAEGADDRDARRRRRLTDRGDGGPGHGAGEGRRGSHRAVRRDDRLEPHTFGRLTMTPAQQHQWAVLAFLLAMIAVTIAFDVYLACAHGPDATISRVLHRLTGRYPTIALAVVFGFGVFVGHCLLHTYSE